MPKITFPPQTLPTQELRSADLFYWQNEVQHFVATVDCDNATVVLSKLHLDCFGRDNLQAVVYVTRIVCTTDILARQGDNNAFASGAVLLACGGECHAVLFDVKANKVVFVATAHDGCNVQTALKTILVYKQSCNKVAWDDVVKLDVLSCKQTCGQFAVFRRNGKVVVFDVYLYDIFAVGKKFG